jgi:hypothetical protein
MFFNKEKRLFFYLAAGSFLAFIVGILSHELGHCVASKFFGYSPILSFDHSSFGFPDGEDAPHDCVVMILAAGPLLTIMIGTIGFALLGWFRRRDRREKDLKTFEWLLVLLASFWLREFANLCMWFTKIYFFYSISLKSDEMKIAGLLRWPDWSIFVISGMISAGVFIATIKKFIPSNQQPVFLSAILTGGILGELLWIQWLGPILLP